MKLGQTVKLMRTAAGLRQKHVAARLHVTPNYISLIENGKREPSVAFLRELAGVLGVPVGLFFLWEETAARTSKPGIGQLRDIVAQLESMYLVAKHSKARKNGRLNATV